MQFNEVVVRGRGAAPRPDGVAFRRGPLESSAARHLVAPSKRPAQPSGLKPLLSNVRHPWSILNPSNTTPSAETLEHFIAQLEENAHAEACEEFYTSDSSMQENQSAPSVGREAHVAHKRSGMARARSVTSTCVRQVFASEDRVVIRWIFHFEWLDGTTTHIEVLAYQFWEGEYRKKPSSTPQHNGFPGNRGGHSYGDAPSEATHLR